MKLFVYGTLRKGGHFARALPEGRKIRLCEVTGLRIYNLGQYPAIIATGDPKDKAMGEVQDYKGVLTKKEEKELLKKLDAIENVASGLYERRTISTPYGKAIIYVANRKVWFDDFLKKRESEGYPLTMITDWASVDPGVAAKLPTLKEEKSHVALRAAEQKD